MADGGESLCLRVESLNSAWTCQKGAEYLEVPFFHIWNSCNPLLHCSFTFRAKERNGNSLLALTLSVQQQNQHTLSETKPATLKMNCDLRHPTSFVSDSPAAQQMTSCQFRLSQGMICTLSTLLDPPNQQARGTEPICHHDTCIACRLVYPAFELVRAKGQSDRAMVPTDCQGELDLTPVYL